MSDSDPALDGRKLRLALEAARMGVWERDLQTNKVVRSTIVDLMFGFAPGEAGDDAATFMARIHPDDAAMMQRSSAEKIARRQPQETEFRVVHGDGSVHWLAARGEAIHDESGRPVRLLSVLSDITARKESEERLRAALATQTMLVGEIHHRVRNNLQMILSMIRLRKSRASKSAQADFDDLSRRVWAIGQIYNQLYGAAAPASVDMAAYVDALCTQMRAGFKDLLDRVAIRARSVPVELDLDTAIPLGLILVEVVTNALKHAFPDKASGTIAIELNAAADRVVLSVRDDGIGMTNVRRTGSLGMSLVDRLTKQIGASLEIGGGPGTQVLISVPRAASSARAAAVPIQAVGAR